MRNLKKIEELMAQRFYEAYETPDGKILLVDDERGAIFLGDPEGYDRYKRRLSAQPVSFKKDGITETLRWIDEFTAGRFYEAYNLSNGNVLLVEDEGGVIVLENYHAYEFYKKSLLGHPIPPSHAPWTWMDEPQHDIDLVVFDLDDTIVEKDKIILPSVKQALAELVKRGVRIAANSVASLEHQVWVFERNGLFPHFVIANMREIYYLTTSGYKPYVSHNDQMRRLWAEVLIEAKKISDSELQRLTAAGISVRREEFDEERRGIIGLLFDNIEDAKAEQRYLERMLSQKGLLTCNRHFNLVQIIHAQAGKGNTLKILAEHWNIPPSKVLCVGDATVDLCMLDGRHGFLSATVSNADREVKDAVRSWGGYIASKPCGEGVVEILSKLKLSGTGQKED